MERLTYRDAGVNLDAAQDIKERIKSIVAPTHGPQVLGGVGGFGALYRLSGYADPVLVSSTDGVGTKLKLAIMMDRYDTIGEDLVNACINDIIVCGAEPLFFLDYLAVASLEQDVVASLISGMARACELAGCALIGGETAQMPGLYADGDFDMAGFVVGAVERDKILDGSGIRPGDAIIGIPSNGLHTNGYSLVRHALGLDDDPTPLNEVVPELGEGVTLGDALLMPHPSYVEAVRSGAAHAQGDGAHHGRRHWSRTSRASCPKERRRDSTRPRGGSRRYSRCCRSAPPSPVMRCTACSTWESGWRWCATPHRRTLFSQACIWCGTGGGGSTRYANGEPVSIV